LRDALDVVVGEQIGNELLLRGAVALEHPADVREAEALDQRLPVIAEPPRRVRVAFLVAVLVVAAMVGGPGEHRSLDGQAAGDRQGDLQAAVRLEGRMREVAVKARADPETRDHVEDNGDHDVVPAETPTPGQRYG